MPITVGSVVWLNSGHGPFTVLDVAGGNALCTQGQAHSLQTIPITALSTTDPIPQIDDHRKTEIDRIFRGHSSNVTPPST